MQNDAVDDFYNFHVQMEVHEEATLEVQVTQPHITQQQPHSPQVPQMVILGPSFNEFKPHAIMVPQSKPRSAKGKMLEIDLGLQVRDMGMSSKDDYKEETPQNLTPKFVKEISKDVLENNKIIEMFQAMVIHVSTKMGNLGLKMQSLTTVEGEKQGLLKHMMKEQEGYEEFRKHIVTHS